MHNVDFVQDYIDAVESGQIKVGRKNTTSNERHKADLKKSEDPDYHIIMTHRSIDACSIY